MSTVRNAIKKIDQAESAAAEQKEAIKALEELGRARAEIFVRDIEKSLMTAGSDSTNKTVPVTYVVGNKKEIRAYSATEVGNIGNLVTSSLNSFLSGGKDSIISGVGNLITGALTTFLGATDAESDTVEMYYVMTDGLAPVRVDLKAWYYSVTATSISTKMERLTTVVATKSVIDVTRIDLGTFNYLFQAQLSAAKMTHEELKEAIKEAAEVYNLFVENSAKKGTLGQQRAATKPEVEAYEKTLAKAVYSRPSKG